VQRRLLHAGFPLMHIGKVRDVGSDGSPSHSCAGTRANSRRVWARSLSTRPAPRRRHPRRREAVTSNPFGPGPKRSARSTGRRDASARRAKPRATDEHPGGMADQHT
jgi:hypothetical protein